MRTASDLHRAAIAYAEQGTAVLPLQPHGKAPATASGVKQATTDTGIIDGWWTAAPNMNIGIATGSRSGIFVLDVDDEAGEQSLRELERTNGDLPETVEAITGKGRHCYFRLGEGVSIRNSAGKLGPGLDVRGNEGFVVAPPSIHPSGRRYEWSVDGASEFADAPQWLLDLVMKKSAPANGAPTSLHVGDAAPYVEAALENERAAVIKAPNGQRNDALNRAAFSLGQLVGSGLLDRARVEAALYSASVANGLVADDGEEATRNTMRSGIESGMLQPRGLPDTKHDETPSKGSADLMALMALMAQDEWPKPDLSVLSEGRRPAPVLPLKVFGDFWAEWITRTAKSKNSAPDYVAASLLSTAASVIGNARWVSPWHGWREPCVIWIATIGKSGTGKSPANDAMTDIISDIERGLAADMDEKWKRHETRKEEAKAIRDRWKDEVKQAAKMGVAAPHIPEDAREPDKPVRPRIRIADATPESLAYLLAANPKGLLFHRDELAGWFGAFDRYAGAGAERAMWIEAFGGREYIVDRVKNDGEPIRVPHLSISVLGGLQPDRLAAMPSNERKALNG